MYYLQDKSTGKTNGNQYTFLRYCKDSKRIRLRPRHIDLPQNLRGSNTWEHLSSKSLPFRHALSSMQLSVGVMGS